MSPRRRRRQSELDVRELTSDSIAPGQGGFYDHPDWYDIVHAQGTAQETRSLLAALASYCDRRMQRLLEPACGTGRYLRALVRHSLRVHGYDLNPRMVEYAARSLVRSGSEARVEVGDMTQFVKPNRFDAAFNLINSFRLLLDEEAALQHLHNTARSLKPNGVYVLGIDLATYDDPDLVEDTWTGRRGRLEVKHLLISLPIDPATRCERIVNHIAAKTPCHETHLQSNFELRAYDVAHWLALLSTSPFHIRAVLDRAWTPIELTPDIGDAYFILARNCDS